MWFDPDQLVKSEQAPPATFATSATFHREVAKETPKVARVARVAPPPVSKNTGTTKPLVRVWRVKVDDGGKVSEMTFIDRECESLAGMTEYVRRIFPTFRFEIALQSEVVR